MQTPETDQIETELETAQTSEQEAATPAEIDASEPAEAAPTAEPAAEAEAAQEATPEAAEASVEAAPEADAADEGKRKRKRKPETLPLPGMEERDIEELVQKAEAYREICDEYKQLGESKRQAKLLLIQTMQKHKRTFYSYRGLTIELSEDVKVAVKGKDEDADVRETKRMVADIEFVAKVKAQPVPEPTHDESLANAEAFFSNAQANADVAEALSDAADNFTAERCDECKAIDGAHDSQCSQAQAVEFKGSLPFEDYLGYAKAMKIKGSVHSWARKWQLTGKEDGKIKAWKEEGAEKAAERIAKAPTTSTKTEPKKRSRNRGRNSHATR